MGSWPNLVVGFIFGHSSRGTWQSSNSMPASTNASRTFSAWPSIGK
ncbi:MAG: hypothetical protein AAF368_19535 [Planctomycetota bacterium]